MDKKVAVKLFQLINAGEVVSRDADGNDVRKWTALGSALHTLGFPINITTRYVGAAKGDTVESAAGVTVATDYKTDYAEISKFLREWADAIEQNEGTRC